MSDDVKTRSVIPVSSADTHELDEAILSTLRRAASPLNAAALRRELPISFRRDKASHDAAIERLLDRGAIFRVGAKLTAIDPLEAAKTALRRALESTRAPGSTPLSDAALKAALKRDAGHASSAYAEAITALVDADEAHAHHWTAAGAHRAKPLGYALHRDPGPDPSVLAAKARAPVEKVTRAALEQGASRGRIAAAIRRLVVSDKELVLEHLRELAAAGQRGELLSLGRLRLATPLDKASFDRAAIALRAERRVNLHQHDEPNQLGPLERACLVADEAGIYYVGVTPRGDAT